MARVVVYRTRYGKFIFYFKKFKVNADLLIYYYGAVVEPRYITVYLRNWKVIKEAKEKYKIDTEEELYKFVLGKGYKGAGVRDWLPKLVG